MKTIHLTKEDLLDLLQGKTLDGFKGVNVKVKVDRDWLEERWIKFFLCDDE